MCVVAVGRRSHAMRAPILFQGIVSVVWWKPEKQKKEQKKNNEGKKNRWFGFWVIEQNVRIDSLGSRVRNPNLFVAVVAIGRAWMYACVFNANGKPGLCNCGDSNWYPYNRWGQDLWSLELVVSSYLEQAAWLSNFANGGPDVMGFEFGYIKT